MNSINKEEKELQELYQEAIKELEGTNESLIVWAGGDAVNQQDALAKLFMDKFPKIPLDIKVDLSKIHDVNIYDGLMNGNLIPDVTMLQTSNDFEDWKKMGVLESFKPAGFDNIRGSYKDDEGYFSIFRMFAFMPQYSKNIIEKEIPKDVIDLIDKKYNLVQTYPHDDDAVLYVFDQLINKYGEDILQKIADLKPLFVRGTAGPPLLVGMNNLTASLTGYETTPNQPSQSYIPKNDFFITWPQRIAMFKDTKHKACAKLFLAYVQSQEFQKTLGSYSVLKDEFLNGTKWVADYENTNPEGFYEFMRDRQHINNLRLLMKKYFGEVKGESPVEDHKMIKLTYGWPYYQE